jgi:hypothetical protein
MSENVGKFEKKKFETYLSSLNENEKKIMGILLEGANEE